jgi:hypothetical protein
LAAAAETDTRLPSAPMLRNARLCRPSSQSIIDEIFGFKSGDFLIGRARDTDRIPDAIDAGLNAPTVRSPMVNDHS